MESGLYWLLENRIVYWKLGGIVSMSGLNADLENLIEALEGTSSSMVHIILDARAISKFKPDGTDVRPNLKRLAKHRTLGKFQTVANNLGIQQKINRLTIDFGTRMLNSRSIYEAMQALKQADSALPVMLPEPVDLAPIHSFLQPE